MKKFRIGLFTSAWDLAALNLVRTVIDNVKNGLIPNAEICFVLVSRAPGETKFGDLMIKMVCDLGVPLVIFPSLQFKSGLRQLGRQEEEKGDKTTIEDWRCFHDQNLQKLLSETDLDVLLGYMWTVSPPMCLARTMINLHPALPGGPKGTFKDVIWHLIGALAEDTGVMMHRVSEVLDMGAPIAYCRYSLRGKDYDSLWLEMAEKLKHRTLEQIEAREGDNNPLFKRIRQAGIARELPIVIWAIKVLAAGEIRISGSSVLNRAGLVLGEGRDLSAEVEATVNNIEKGEIG